MDQDQASEDAIVVATEASTQTAPTSGSTGKRAQGKKFGCTHQGCNKRFTRMEHMQRHALNHTAVDSTCPRCNVVFKRPDLLGGKSSTQHVRSIYTVPPLIIPPREAYAPA